MILMLFPFSGMAAIAFVVARPKPCCPRTIKIAQGTTLMHWVICSFGTKSLGTLVCLETATKSNKSNHVFSLWRVVVWDRHYWACARMWFCLNSFATVACCAAYHNLLLHFYIWISCPTIGTSRYWCYSLVLLNLPCLCSLFKHYKGKTETFAINN